MASQLMSQRRMLSCYRSTNRCISIIIVSMHASLKFSDLARHEINPLGRHSHLLKMLYSDEIQVVVQKLMRVFVEAINRYEIRDPAMMLNLNVGHRKTFMLSAAHHLRFLPRQRMRLACLIVNVA